MAIHKYTEDGKQLYRVHVKIRNIFGKQMNRVRKGISSETRAKRLEIELKVELLKLRDSPNLFFWTDWVDECIRRMKLEFRNSTIIGYEKNLAKWVHPHLKHLRIDHIKKRDIHNVIFEHITGVSDETKRTVLKQVKRILAMAVEEGLIVSNPAVGLKVKVAEKLQVCLNNEEINVLLEKAYLSNHPWYEVWVVALMSGLRSGELYALLWTDVDFTNKFISINKSWTNKNGLGPTKSSHNRNVPISASLFSFLKELKIKSVTPYVLPRSKDWDQGAQAKVLREFCRLIGITEVKFHDLRASFITQMLIKDVSLAKVMKIVGHASIKTTMKYLRLIAKDVEGATDALTIELPSIELKEGKVFHLFKN